MGVRRLLAPVAAMTFTVKELCRFEAEAEAEGDRRAADLWREAVAHRCIEGGGKNERDD